MTETATSPQTQILTENDLYGDNQIKGKSGGSGMGISKSPLAKKPSIPDGSESPAAVRRRKMIRRRTLDEKELERARSGLLPDESRTEPKSSGSVSPSSRSFQRGLLGGVVSSVADLAQRSKNAQEQTQFMRKPSTEEQDSGEFGFRSIRSKSWSSYDIERMLSDDEDTGAGGEKKDARRRFKKGVNVVIATRKLKQQARRKHQFLLACESGDVVSVLAALELNQEVIYIRDFQTQKTALHYAAENGHADICRLLLRQGAQVNAQNKNGATPLHAAVAQGRLAVAEMLVNCGADMHARVWDDWLPSHIAAYNGRLSMLAFLVEQGGCYIDAQDINGWTPLHYAAAQGHLDVTRYILGLEDVNVDVVNRHGATPLHLACLYGHESIVKLMLDNGANPQARHENGKTPLDMAKTEEIEELIKYYIKNPRSHTKHFFPCKFLWWK